MRLDKKPPKAVEFKTPPEVLAKFATRFEKLGDLQELLEEAGFSFQQFKDLYRERKENGLGTLITRRGRKNLVDPDALFEALQGLEVTPE